MLGKIRNFSKSKFAGLLVVIIIIPFVFWGMGNVFSGGNTNNVAKINNKTISTKDFVDYINDIKINPEYIKNNINNNILENILSDLISQKLFLMEIKSLNINISDEALVKNLQSSKIFQDEAGNFSRLKYEKYLLDNNTFAAKYENALRDSKLRQNFSKYIGGGVKSPYFMKNDIYKNEKKVVEIHYYNLDEIYNLNITTDEIENYVEKNEDKLKEDYIDFAYTKITPKDVIEINEFNSNFYEKIDEIENKILNNVKLENIILDFNFILDNKKDFILDKNNTNDIFEEIYSNRDNKGIQLIDKNDYFLIYEIKRKKRIIPDLESQDFLKKVKNEIILKRKLDLNRKLFDEIQDKKFNDKKFIELARDKTLINKKKINHIDDYKIFDENSVRLIYSLPKNSFLMTSDIQNNIYLAKINNITVKNINRNDEIILKYQEKSNNLIVENIFNSYDSTLSKKYDVKIFNTSIDRVKDYFK